MRSLWRRKWLVIPVAAVIVLVAGAAGAIAVADPGGDGSDSVLSESRTAATVALAGEVAADPGQSVDEIEKLRAKILERLERIKQRWEDARGRMTPDDQSAFDRLREEAKDRREALREARQDLTETLKQMRDLVRKYLPAPPTTSTPQN